MMGAIEDIRSRLDRLESVMCNVIGVVDELVKKVYGEEFSEKIDKLVAYEEEKGKDSE